MTKTVLTIDGMSCSMYESHVNDAIRRAFSVKKVTSSHKKGVCEILSEATLDEADLRSALGPTGYRVLEIKSEPFEKKGFWGGIRNGT